MEKTSKKYAILLVILLIVVMIFFLVYKAIGTYSKPVEKFIANITGGRITSTETYTPPTTPPLTPESEVTTNPTKVETNGVTTSLLPYTYKGEKYNVTILHRAENKAKVKNDGKTIENEISINLHKDTNLVIKTSKYDPDAGWSLRGNDINRYELVKIKDEIFRQKWDIPGGYNEAELLYIYVKDNSNIKKCQYNQECDPSLMDYSFSFLSKKNVVNIGAEIAIPKSFSKEERDSILYKADEIIKNVKL